MAIAKCRLDMWNPTLGGNATNKWITAQTPENRNAVISVYIFDKLANPRTAEVIISNRAKNFAAPVSGTTPPSTFSYTYKDSDGVNSTTVTDQPLRTGVLTDLFSDFQFIRLVDEATHQVLFVGRVLSITESYDAGKGITLKLKAVDALYELAKITLRGLSESIEFTQTTHSVTDIVKALISLLYKKEKLGVGGTKHINANSGSSTTANVADCIADTIYYPTATVNQYRTNIVTDDTGSELRNRFVTELVKLPKDRKIDLTKIKKEGFLGVILEILQANPQDAQTNSEKFGWDYFVDPNISYGKHADFRGKNLDASTKPPPMMFNAFERGNRIYNIEPATYGLAVKFPAASNVVTQGHKIVAGENIQFATKPMSVGFDFTRPKDDLYSSVLLKYNDGTEGKDSDRKEAGQGQEKEIIMEIIYVTLISGTFKYQIISGSGNTRTYSQSDYDDDEAWVGANEEPASRPGVRSSEWLSLYTVASGGTGTPIRGKAARIQYQSDATLSGSDVGYIIVSGVSSELLNVASGTYILKGMGDGTGTNGSGATCRVDLGTSIANQGYPRRVWGLDKQKVVSKGVINDLGALRQEAASTLSRSSVDIIDGDFSISGAPVYYWDGEIKTVSSVTGGQRVTFQNVGLTTDVELWRYGFRAGMLMARMNDSYTAIDQEAGKDVYGYCFNVESDTQYDVNLTETESFAADEKVRCFIPLRAGDTIRVENVITNVAGNHLIKEITYTEEPNQMTRLKTTGVNEGFGLGVTGFQASLAGMREESDIRMNLPKGHQVATWTGLFSAVDNNTVQWQTVGGKAEVILAGGSVYNVDCATTNNNNTTDASGTDNDSDRFGLATPPAAGDDTVYYIYLDPNKENVEKGIGKSHFYTRPSSSPDTGTDPVYDQDGDNVIIGWMKAGATADDLAEFGVYRDSKPGEGKRNLPSISHPGSATSALLKKGAQTFTSDLQVQASLWADDLARREVKWHGGEATADTTHANIKLADGDDRTIAYGGDSGDTGGGSYSYTTNGTSYSTLAAFVDNTTYYGFIDFKEDATGNMILRWTNSHTIPYGDNRVLLVMIVIPPDATKGRSPIIIPFGTKSLSINAVAIAANSITADHIGAGTISTDHITGTIAGSKISIDTQTTFSSGFDPRDYSKTETTASGTEPSSPNAGDVWIDTSGNATDNYDFKRWSGSAWVSYDLGLSRLRANSAFTNAATAQTTADGKNKIFGGTQTTSSGIANEVTGEVDGDLYINTNTQDIYKRESGTWVVRNDAKTTANAAAVVAARKRQVFNQTATPTANLEQGDIWINNLQRIQVYDTSAGWQLRDDAGAINLATTDINGGRIGTQTIVLTRGGALNVKVLGDPLSSPYTPPTGGTRIILSHDGIYGWNSDVVQFYIKSTDGKAYFAGGKVIADYKGLNIIENGSGSATWVGVGFYNGGQDWNTNAILSISPSERGTIHGSASSGRITVDSPLSYKIIDLNSTRLERVGGVNVLNNNTTWWTFPSDVPSSGEQITATGSGSGTMADPYQTNWMSAGSGGSGEANEYSFKTIAITGTASQTNVVADADDDTLTLHAGTNMTINTSGDTITFNASGAAANHNHSSTYSTFAFKQIDINNTSGSYSGGSWGTSGIAAASIDDILYLVEGSNITLESYSGGSGGSRPAIKISASGGGSGTVTSGDAGYVAYYPNAAATVDSRIAGGIEFISGTNMKMHGHVNLQGYSLKFEERGSGTDTVSIQAPSYIGTSYTLTLPQDDGDPDQVLKTNGSGILDWVDQSSGGGSGTVNPGSYGYVPYYVTAGNSGTTLDDNLSPIQFFGSGNMIKMWDDIEMQNYGIYFRETNGGSTNTVQLKAPASINSNFTLYLPSDDGSPNEVLKTDGSGNLDWVANSGGMTSWNIAAESAGTTAISNGDDVRFRASSPAILITRVNNDIYLNHGDTSDLADTNHSGQTFIQNLEFDQYGHVDGYSVGTASGGGDANTNSFKFIARSGTGSGSTITAQNDEDTITFVAGSNMTINHGGTGANPTIEFVASGSVGVTSIATTAPILGGTITGTGTITHSTASGNRHIPTGGSGSSGSRQVLTYNGVDGTATFQAASEHGTHGGGGGLTYWSESSSAFYPSSSSVARSLGTATNGIGWLYIDNSYGIKTNWSNTASIIWETHGHHEFEADTYIKSGNDLTCESDFTVHGSCKVISLYGTGSTDVARNTSSQLSLLSSTMRIKQDIRPLEIDTSRIWDLDVQSYELKKYKIEGNTLHISDEIEKTDFGLIAEELYEVLPELVTLDDEGLPFSILNKNLIMVLLAEMKTLRARVDVLEGN